jgi:hypothetical protein
MTHKENGAPGVGPGSAVGSTTSTSADHSPTRKGVIRSHHTPGEQPAAKVVGIGTKRAAVLRELLKRGGHGLNRFEAERIAFDHVLPSTISELCSDFGLEIPRFLETVTGHFGKPTDCMRYWLSKADRVKVRKLLDQEPEPSA